MLSGFAKNTTEKTTAETLTWNVKGVKAVKNEITVRP
jgi:osmotically-inducible protein OsmY